jgi:hypothetical protein
LTASSDTRLHGSLATMNTRGNEWNERYKRPHMQYLRSALSSRYLEKELPFFVSGEEASPTDAGLLTEDSISLENGAPIRAEAVHDRFGTTPVILPLDFKFITPNPLTRKGYATEWYEYRFHLMPQQEKVAAFVIGSPLDPNNVVVLPSSYVNPQKGPKETKYASRKVSMLEAQVAAFPSEWLPFVMPLSMLPQALQHLLDYYKGRSAMW